MLLDQWIANFFNLLAGNIQKRSGVFGYIIFLRSILLIVILLFVAALLLAMIGLAYAATLAFRLFLHKCKLD
jgi:type II secretory pathway component PulL